MAHAPLHSPARIVRSTGPPIRLQPIAAAGPAEDGPFRGATGLYLRAGETVKPDRQVRIGRDRRLRARVLRPGAELGAADDGPPADGERQRRPDQQSGGVDAPDRKRETR